MGENNVKDVCEYEVTSEGEDTTLRVGCEKCLKVPSLEEDSICMSRLIEKLAQNPKVTKILFSQKRDYEYDYEDTLMIVEIAVLYNKFIREKQILSYQNLSMLGAPIKTVDEWYTELQHLVFDLIKKDPVGAYTELKRIIRRETILQEKSQNEKEVVYRQRYASILQYIKKAMEATKLIAIATPYLAGHEVGNREVYTKIFSPIIKPDFMYTKLMASYPKNGIEVASFIIGEDEETEVTVFKFADDVQTLYHISPPEFKLSEEKYELLDAARNILSSHKPKKSEFVEPQRMREVFFNVGKDLIEELANYKNIKINEKEAIALTKILVRYTVGFGLIEILLQDEDVQDISINSPLGHIPIFIVHGKFDDCITNIYPMSTEAQSWATKLRLISGRPLDEADPLLDTELELPGASTRVSAITEPLNPTGLAFSFRRHRDKPWTLPLFIKTKMLTPLGAGLISFIIDGTRTMLIAGTRSSGKTSFLSSLLVEIMRRYRIITVEDTLELPTAPLRRLGFNIQPMKVSSALARESTEMNASDGIRSTLRLGDSALIVGEVRSAEAKALYEAMRVGAAANVVAGTIHGDSPFGIFDRVVNDIGVPKTSFKATDIIIIANPIKSADGLHKNRRITQITEVRKTWEEDPLLEQGFIDLMKYDATTDQLQPTDDFIRGNSDILKLIAENIPDFAGNWQAVWENILLRAKIKELIVEYSNKEKDNSLLEADFVIKCNDIFHITVDKVKQRKGKIVTEDVIFEWEEWLKRELQKRKMQKKEKEEEIKIARRPNR